MPNRTPMADFKSVVGKPPLREQVYLQVSWILDQLAKIMNYCDRRTTPYWENREVVDCEIYFKIDPLVLDFRGDMPAQVDAHLTRVIQKLQTVQQKFQQSIRNGELPQKVAKYQVVSDMSILAEFTDGLEAENCARRRSRPGVTYRVETFYEE